MQGFFNICKVINVMHPIKKLKSKTHTIISIDAEKAFDKLQHPFMIKTVEKVGIEGTYLNIIKATYNKHTSNVLVNGEKMKAFSSNIGNRTGMSVFTISIQHSFGHSNQSRKRNKRNPNWKGRSKTPTVCR